MDGGWISEGRLRPLFVGFVIHTGGMDQEFAEERAKRHPKGAANSIHYTLLGQQSRSANCAMGGVQAPFRGE
jgi:hypothetical protein